jgi:hypothetical protein
MKTLASICACIALITGIVSVNLWRELRTERQANVELRTRFNVARLPGSAPAMPAPVTTNVAPTAVAAAAAEAPVCKSDSPSQPTQTVAAIPVQNVRNRQTELMMNPEYRKLRLAQQRLNVERNNWGLAEELGLSDNEANRLFDLLSENQLAMMNETQLLSVNGTQDRPGSEEVMRRRQALQREQDEALRAMLGGKYSQYQDYQQSRPARSQAMAIGTQLAQAGLPLTDAQTRSLTTAMRTAQQQQAQDPWATAPGPAAAAPMDPDTRIKMMEESLKRMEDNNRRTIEAVAPHMSARQLAAYREQLEQQAAMNRISIKMQIEQQRLQAQPQPAR